MNAKYNKSITKEFVSDTILGEDIEAREVAKAKDVIEVTKAKDARVVKNIVSEMNYDLRMRIIPIMQDNIVHKKATEAVVAESEKIIKLFGESLVDYQNKYALHAHNNNNANKPFKSQEIIKSQIKIQNINAMLSGIENLKKQKDELEGKEDGRVGKKMKEMDEVKKLKKLKEQIEDKLKKQIELEEQMGLKKKELEELSANLKENKDEKEAELKKLKEQIEDKLKKQIELKEQMGLKKLDDEVKKLKEREDEQNAELKKLEYNLKEKQIAMTQNLINNKRAELNTELEEVEKGLKEVKSLNITEDELKAQMEAELKAQMEAKLKKLDDLLSNINKMNMMMKNTQDKINEIHLKIDYEKDTKNKVEQMGLKKLKELRAELRAKLNAEINDDPKIDDPKIEDEITSLPYIHEETKDYSTNSHKKLHSERSTSQQGVNNLKDLISNEKEGYVKIHIDNKNSPIMVPKSAVDSSLRSAIEKDDRFGSLMINNIINPILKILPTDVAHYDPKAITPNSNSQYTKDYTTISNSQYANKDTLLRLDQIGEQYNKEYRQQYNDRYSIAIKAPVMIADLAGKASFIIQVGNFLTKAIKLVRVPTISNLYDMSLSGTYIAGSVLGLPIISAATAIGTGVGSAVNKIWHGDFAGAGWALGGTALHFGAALAPVVVLYMNPLAGVTYMIGTSVYTSYSSVCDIKHYWQYEFMSPRESAQSAIEQQKFFNLIPGLGNVERMKELKADLVRVYSDKLKAQCKGNFGHSENECNNEFGIKEGAIFNYDVRIKVSEVNENSNDKKEVVEVERFCDVFVPLGNNDHIKVCYNYDSKMMYNYSSDCEVNPYCVIEEIQQ